MKHQPNFTGECRCCSAVSIGIFSSILFDRNVNYFDCPACGYVQTESPYWFDQAYSSAINNCDTGIMVRNQANVGLVMATMAELGQLNSNIVDCAGGYGILVRLLRDRGISALWSDPYCQNLLAVGFEHTTEKAKLVTAFEAFEHFVDPVLEAEKLFTIAPNLLISTVLIPNPAPPPDEWWYYGLDHGQHIGFFRLQTLKLIARKFDKYLITDGVGCHLFTEKPLNSLQWNFNVRIARRFPLLYGLRLKSKVWQDFEKMSSKQ